MRDVEEFWNRKAQTLVGKKVKAASYMSEEEAEALGWHSRPLVIEFDDGSVMFPSMDDEGNNAGSLFGQTADGDSNDFPVI
jgi:hypothetical protein